jgi:tetraprenyl-beta-curcumene synthase
MVEKELSVWRKVAASIPDEELQRQAVASLDKKRFHCQGGSVYALYTPLQGHRMITFIVALQTISDYLDNLCDRVSNADEQSFAVLHGAMKSAVDASVPVDDWYKNYPYREDGSYLDFLVRTSQRVITFLPGYRDVREDILHLVTLYSDLQVFKHLGLSVREEMLIRWFSRHQSLAPDISWWEFAAAAGSTLGVFALAAMAAGGNVSNEETELLLDCYFPWLCGLHILLDYFIDLDEDREHGDLNFVAYYPSPQAMEDGLVRFLDESLSRVEKLPRPAFHSTVIKGLLALYLSDPKAVHPARKKVAQRLLRRGGGETLWLHRVCLRLRRQGVI